MRFEIILTLELLCSHEQIFPPVDVAVLPGEELRHLPGRELRLTDVSEVPGEVDGLPLHQAGQQGHVTRLPPPGRQRQTESVQFSSQHFPSVFRLCPPEDSAQ